MFYKIWEGAEQNTNEYKSFRVDWWDVPGRDRAWREQTINNTSQMQFDQEFGNTFFGTGDTLINAESLMGLKARPPIRNMEGGKLLVYKEPEKGRQYICMVDVARGRGQDYSTFQMIDVTSRPFEQVAVYRDNTISPILFPNVIWKYAKVWNNAYTIIESNDAGSVVTTGLYYDLEYEEVHTESNVKSSEIGILMTKKVKRIGCSAIKDLMENNKILLHDENTILEASTFVAKGVSYEASSGNHDDLMMNLVLFGYFVQTQYFMDMTDINLKQMLYEKKIREMEEDIVPFGFIDDGSEYIDRIEDKKPEWYVEFD
jgi:hypothetical protein